MSGNKATQKMASSLTTKSALVKSTQSELGLEKEENAEALVNLYIGLKKSLDERYAISAVHKKFSLQESKTTTAASLAADGLEALPGIGPVLSTLANSGVALHKYFSDKNERDKLNNFYDAYSEIESEKVAQFHKKLILEFINENLDLIIEQLNDNTLDPELINKMLQGSIESQSQSKEEKKESPEAKSPEAKLSKAKSSEKKSFKVPDVKNLLGEFTLQQKEELADLFSSHGIDLSSLQGTANSEVGSNSNKGSWVDRVQSRRESQELENIPQL